MAIKKITKQITKGNAIIDLQEQIKSAFNIINSAILNVESAAEELRGDPDFSIDNMQEFKSIITYALDQTDKLKSSWQEIFDSIIIE
jgi:hypothetical protein